MPTCRWCEATYSTGEELAKHEERLWNHYAERVERAERMVKDLLVEREELYANLTAAQEAGSALTMRLQAIDAQLRDLIKRYRLVSVEQPLEVCRG